MSGVDSSIVISVTSAEFDDWLIPPSSIVVTALGSPAIADGSVNAFVAPASRTTGTSTITSLGSVASIGVRSNVSGSMEKLVTVASFSMTSPSSSGVSAGNVTETMKLSLVPAILPVSPAGLARSSV